MLESGDLSLEVGDNLLVGVGVVDLGVVGCASVVGLGGGRGRQKRGNECGVGTHDGEATTKERKLNVKTEV